MTIVVLTDCPPKLRGDLSKWLLEINTGVYVGRVSARVRDALWERICENVKNGRATMVYRANNEQRMAFRVHNTTWEPVDFDGVMLLRHPCPATPAVGEAAFLAGGFSKAAQQQKTRRMARARANTGDSYVAVDIETTGLHPQTDELIELAAVRVENGRVMAEFQRLVRPSQALPPEITRLTGLTDKVLCEQGIDLEEAMEAFVAFVGKTPMVCHNAAFDRPFLERACMQCGLAPLQNRVYDTLVLARCKVQGVQNYKLETLAAHFGIEQMHAHRALDDCHAVRMLYDKLKEM